jgi:hypothetical protein
MTQSEFEAEATSAAYISGVATALRVAETSVSIVSLEEQSTGRRRKLLLTSVVVETNVIVSAEQAEAVVGRITADNLNSALNSFGIFIDEVFGISNVTGTAAFADWGIMGIVAGGMVLAAGCIVWCRRRSRRSAAKVSYQVAASLISSQVSASIGYIGKEDALEEAAKGYDAKVTCQHCKR